MRTVKSLFGVFGALLPVLYCGGLLIYFSGVAGSVEESSEIGLGPTMGGLLIVGVLFCIPLMLKIVRFVTRVSTPSPGGAAAAVKASGIDADAVIARYMARNPSEADAQIAPSPKPGGAGPGGFGRRT